MLDVVRPVSDTIFVVRGFSTSYIFLCSSSLPVLSWKCGCGCSRELSDGYYRTEGVVVEEMDK